MEAPFVIPISLREIILALKAKNVIKGFVVGDNIELPPGITITYTIPVDTMRAYSTSGYNTKLVAIPLEYAAQPDPDYAIAGKFYIDDQIIINDPAMSADLYNKPFEFLTNYSLAIHATKQLSASFTNVSDQTARISFRTVFGIMPDNTFKKIIDSFSGKIRDFLLHEPDIYR